MVLGSNRFLSSLPTSTLDGNQRVESSANSTQGRGLVQAFEAFATVSSSCHFSQFSDMSHLTNWEPLHEKFEKS